jgi:hypothetical protein
MHGPGRVPIKRFFIAAERMRRCYLLGGRAMTPCVFRVRNYVLLFVLLAMVAVTAKVTFDHALLSLRISFAEDQVEIFDEMRTKALLSNPVEGADALENAVNYYPSGTKQALGSRLDRIVERARQIAVHDILADLRVKTGRDLGDDPQPWIDAYHRGN